MFDSLISEDEEDYGTQVKIFYHPIFDEHLKEWMFDQPTWHSGGMCKTYKIGDNVPIKTRYYEYPESFYIYVGDYEEMDLAVIKNGVFVGFVKDFTTINEILPFYTYRGDKIKAESLEEFSCYVQEYHGENEKEPTKRNYIDFAKRWYQEVPEWYLLGELLDCWLNESRFMDTVEEYGAFKINHKIIREAIEKEIKTFVSEKPSVFADYCKKFNIDSLPFLSERHE